MNNFNYQQIYQRKVKIHLSPCSCLCPVSHRKQSGVKHFGLEDMFSSCREQCKLTPIFSVFALPYTLGWGLDLSSQSLSTRMNAGMP